MHVVTKKYFKTVAGNFKTLGKEGESMPYYDSHISFFKTGNPQSLFPFVMTDRKSDIFGHKRTVFLFYEIMTF